MCEMNFGPVWVNTEMTHKIMLCRQTPDKQVLVFYHVKLTSKVFWSKSLNSQQRSEVTVWLQICYPNLALLRLSYFSLTAKAGKGFFHTPKKHNYGLYKREHDKKYYSIENLTIGGTCYSMFYLFQRYTLISPHTVPIILCQTFKQLLDIVWDGTALECTMGWCGMRSCLSWH